MISKLMPIGGARNFRWKLQSRLRGSCALKGLVEWKGENVLHVHDQGGFGKCKVGAPYSFKGLGVGKGN